ncbi:Kae1-like domain-containing protein [Alkaliphilus sp. B6464]|uniref:Kae1-like domain-containing protein n=1 Tax=Alkaliphilus sp. B6464 TaxID=2731219 RepID=UPI001BA7DC0F|nr:O-sialoglycoprotein endopeptidase [Alkaliphilus sp. B6464]QUH20697.1 O-sialoglycoprotein endopeptidase [Alkaliphilus sp. B6464]
MSNEAILGLDTSNYTTSMTLMTLDGQVIYDARKLLPVDKGKKGLRQSDALFHHIKHIPILADEITKSSKTFSIVAISASTRPRPVEDSYMPVFLASKSYGETMSKLWHIPFFEFSHQEGHIAAGLWSEQLDFKEDFIALHISGGTTEILKVKPLDVGYEIKIIGGSSDISAGQLIDRIGTKMGLPFPSGSHLEKISKNIKSVDFNAPFSVANNTVSFSGPETYFSRLINDGTIKYDEISYATFDCIAKSLVLLIKGVIKQYNLKKVLIVGGVASNGQIRSHLSDKLSKENINIYFANSKYCTDNAVGVAALGLFQYLKQNYTI